MKIEKNSAVTLRIQVSDSKGNVMEDGKHPVSYLHGGYGNLFPRLEAALEGQEVGFESRLELPAEDAFGARDESLVQSIPKSQFPPGVKVGGQLEARTPEGQMQVFTVLKIKGDTVFLDGNHPHAGKALKISLKVLEIRPASEEEIAHGHVHGAHGHHH